MGLDSVTSEGGLDELKENPLVKFSSSLSGLIGIMDEMTKSTKFDNVTLNNGAVHKIYQVSQLKLYIGTQFRGYDSAVCILNPETKMYFVCQPNG